MAWDCANRALVEADDLYEIKSSESSEEVVVAEVPVEPALSTVACDDEDDEVLLDLLRIALYSSVDRVEVVLSGTWLLVCVEPYAVRSLYAVSPYLLLMPPLPLPTPLLSSSFLV